MERAAEESGAQISAVLFGAICGAGVLPFRRAQFEAAIRGSGFAVDANLRGFNRGCRGVGEATAPAPVGALRSDALPGSSARAKRALARVDETVREGARALTRVGVARMFDYQDAAYAHLYLDRLEKIAALDASVDAKLTAETARYLALWMSFEDIFRVADLKTRASRFARVRKEVRATEGQIVRIVEFMHPRYEEFCDALPASLGAWALRSRALRKMMSPLFASGRQVRTTSLRWFLLLFVLARAKGWRRATLRYRDEQTRIEDWLDGVVEAAKRDMTLALELVECQRLVKGYSDTHKRGLANFATIWRFYESERDAGTPTAALGARIRRLRDAALADEQGAALEAALASEART
jgi:indolepyruvate ferredoxin oxidoreductase beta subunit